MTRKNILITSLSIIALLAMASLSFAGQGHGRGYGHGYMSGKGCGYGVMSYYSDLTPEKQAAVDKIVEKHSAKQLELRDKMWAKHATLEAMINAGNADEAKISKLISEMSALRDQMWENRNALRTELEKETGIVMHNRSLGRGGYGPGTCYDSDGQGRGRGMNRW